MEHVIDSSTEVLTRKQAAAFLGLSQHTLASWASNKRYELPFFRLGRLVMYRRADLEAFVSRLPSTAEAA